MQTNVVLETIHSLLTLMILKLLIWSGLWQESGKGQNGDYEPTADHIPRRVIRDLEGETG